VDGDVCQGTRPDGTPCGEPLSPSHSRRSDRCEQCRQEHRASKQADYQWQQRVRERERAVARRRATMHPRPDDLPPIPPRTLTPSWTQKGQPAPTDQDHLQALAGQLADLQRSVTAVRAALAAATHQPGRRT